MSMKITPLRWSLEAEQRHSRFAQQRVFDRFRTTFNSERPHEALNMATPATLYVPSSRQYPRALQSPEYPDGWQVQRVRRDGSIRLGDKDIAISATLRGEPVGIEYREDGGCMKTGHLKMGETVHY